MRDYSAIVSDLTPGQWECVKQEYRISPSTFSDKVKLIVPSIADEDVGVLVAEFEAEAAARE